VSVFVCLVVCVDPCLYGGTLTFVFPYEKRGLFLRRLARSTLVSMESLLPDLQHLGAFIYWFLILMAFADELVLTVK
jgi:hypothetical protein